jgi:hypothetical protein
MGSQPHQAYLLELPIPPLGRTPGRKRALIAVGHSILVIFYHMVKSRMTYNDLGGDFFDQLQPQRLTRYYVQRLKDLGHKVTLECSMPA